MHLDINVTHYSYSFYNDSSSVNFEGFLLFDIYIYIDTHTLMFDA